MCDTQVIRIIIIINLEGLIKTIKMSLNTAPTKLLLKITFSDKWDSQKCLLARQM